MKKKKQAKRMSKLEKHTAAVIQDHAHMSSADITRRREVLTSTQKVLEEEIAELSLKIQQAKVNRSKLEATLDGLGIVIGRR